jgi:hypothetical protein
MIWWAVNTLKVQFSLASETLHNSVSFLSLSLSLYQAIIKQYLCDWFDTQSSSSGSSSSSSSSSSAAPNLCVVATSNRPADVDPRLRRGGRLEREIDVTGSKTDRSKLLLALLSPLLTPEQGWQCWSSMREDVVTVVDLIADRTGNSTLQFSSA